MKRILLILLTMLVIMILVLNIYFNYSFDIEGNLLCVVNNNELSQVYLKNGDINCVFSDSRYEDISYPFVYNDEIVVCCRDVYDNTNKIIGIDKNTHKVKEYYSTNNFISNPKFLTNNILAFLMKESEEYYLYLLNIYDDYCYKGIENSVSDVGFSIIDNNAILVSVKEKNGICARTNIYMVYPDGTSAYICEGSGATWAKDSDAILYNNEGKVYLLNMNTKEKSLIKNQTVFFSTPVFVDRNTIFFIDYDEVGLFSGATLPYCYVMDIETKKKIKFIDYLKRKDVKLSEQHYDVGILGMDIINVNE